MLKGIDISDWQSSLELPNIASQIDFVVCKATEGIGYVAKSCDKFVQAAIKNSLLWGFYHFARNNSPVTEAEYFYKNCTNYFTHGIPVLDIEDDNIKDWIGYTRRFVDRIHELSGVYPLVYCSAAYCGRFANSTIANDCGLWVAGYPKGYTSFVDVSFPYNVRPWNQVAIWQFTSNGKLDGYNGKLDLNYAYMTKDAWMRYANPNGISEDNSSEDDVLREHVIEDDEYRIIIEKKK